MAERYVRAGPLSTKGAGSINFGFYKPQYDYGKEDLNASSGLSPQSGDNNVDTSALNKLADPFPDGTPKRSYSAGMGGMDPSASSTMPETVDEALAILKSQVYNPATKKFEDSTKYSYPGSKYMPDRFNAIDAALLFGSPNADVSGMDMQGILDNASDSQATVMQLMHDNPTASVQQVMDSYHSNETGFDVNTGEMLSQDPFNTQQSFDQFHQQNVQDWKDSGQVHSGSVFDEGGIFGGGFFNKGGKAGGK